MSSSITEQKLAGGVAVITGAGGGLGSGLARRAASLGMTIVVADIAFEKAQEVADGIINAGGQAEAVSVDVSQPANLYKLADHVFSRYGAVRLLINNAGIEALGECWELSPSCLETTLNVNIHGVVHGVRAFLPRMIESGKECWIANVSSIGAFGIVPSQSIYILTKHAVQAFTEGLYVDLKLRNSPIHVCSITPGLLKTNIFDSEEDGYVIDPNTQLSEHQTHMAKLARLDGMDVEEASEIIMRQITEGKFWVITHPEVTKQFLNHRSNFFLAQSNPTQ